MAHVGPGVTFGLGLRIANPKYISIGANTWIDDDVLLLAGPPSGLRKLKRKPNSAFKEQEGQLTIGANCHIAPQVTLQAHGGLTIGDNSGVASGCRLYSLSHHYKWQGDPTAETVYKFSPRAPPNEQTLLCGPVVMEQNTGIGTNSIVLPGGTIREGTWVGVLSVVVGELSGNSIAVGNPAKCIKQIRPLAHSSTSGASTSTGSTVP
jgi:galactoside O-acetyltransferase